MVAHGGSSAGSYLADPTSPIPSHCASIVATSTVRVKVTSLCSDTIMIILPMHWSCKQFQDVINHTKTRHQYYDHSGTSNPILLLFLSGQFSQVKTHLKDLFRAIFWKLLPLPRTLCFHQCVWISWFLMKLAKNDYYHSLSVKFDFENT